MRYFFNGHKVLIQRHDKGDKVFLDGVFLKGCRAFSRATSTDAITTMTFEIMPSSIIEQERTAIETTSLDSGDVRRFEKMKPLPDT